MRKFYLVSLLILAACGTSTEPQRSVPATTHKDLTCKSGYYVIAYRSDGTAYCAPVDSLPQ